MTTKHNIANCKKSLLTREIAGVLLLELVHGLLVTTSVIKESPKSSDAQQILFALKAFIVIELNIKTSNSSVFVVKYGIFCKVGWAGHFIWLVRKMVKAVCRRGKG